MPNLIGGKVSFKFDAKKMKDSDCVGKVSLVAMPGFDQYG